MTFRTYAGNLDQWELSTDYEEFDARPDTATADYLRDIVSESDTDCRSFVALAPFSDTPADLALLGTDVDAMADKCDGSRESDVSVSVLGSFDSILEPGDPEY